MRFNDEFEAVVNYTLVNMTVNYRRYKEVIIRKYPKSSQTEMMTWYFLLLN